MLNQLRELSNSTFKEFENYYHNIYETKELPHPAWQPTQDEIEKTNLYRTMQAAGFSDYNDFYQWSITQREAFLEMTLKTLGIRFKKKYTHIFENKEDPENIQWFPNAKLNIIDSCFMAPSDKTAIIFQDSDETRRITYGDLEKLVNRLANSISKKFKKGAALAINMPMNLEAVAIYLAIIKAGCVVVSIADSFAPEEIATRLEISNAEAIFTQDYYLRNHKKIQLYDKVKQANSPMAIVLCLNSKTELRHSDLRYDHFISDNSNFESVSCDPNVFSTVLFSSGTTGTPKAIPWTHATPVRAAMDGYYHEDIQMHDVVAWPTNLGWMMGPWLVYACFINGATMALCNEAPTQEAFGKFVQDNRITILGLVPSIVSVWKTKKNMEAFDWSAIKCFSSSGECSNPNDYLYLMWLGGCKPIIEYCGGTEIDGGYISSTLIQPNTPSMFTTPTLGMQFVLLNENLELTEDEGEVALVPPALGLSQTLLNRDHHTVYFDHMPNLNGIPLRRHGDRIKKINNNCFQNQGRVDDAMNLGGIKISAAEIERLLNETDGVKETAAIAATPENNGPSKLVIYAVCNKPQDKTELQKQLQHTLKTRLNPLFKISDLILIDALPRTASNKIMHRTLRDLQQ